MKPLGPAGPCIAARAEFAPLRRWRSLGGGRLRICVPQHGPLERYQAQPRFAVRIL